MVGQQREGLDRLRSRQQARGTWPKVWPKVAPGLAGIGRRWRDPLNRAFRHVARDRSKAIEMMFADSIGERVAAGGRQGEPRDFCDNSAKAAMPQAFLETDEDGFLIARFDIDHAVGHEPGLRKSRGEEVRACEAP
jgi:hypothetical protein